MDSGFAAAALRWEDIFDCCSWTQKCLEARCHELLLIGIFLASCPQTCLLRQLIMHMIDPDIHPVVVFYLAIIKENPVPGGPVLALGLTGQLFTFLFSTLKCHQLFLETF